MARGFPEESQSLTITRTIPYIMNTTKEKIHPADAPDGEFFFGVLKDADAGQLLRQLDDDTRSLVSQVLKTGGKGKVVLTIACSKCGSEMQVKLTPKVKAEVPNLDVQERILYADPTGRLHRNDPRQEEFDFDAPRKVEAPKVERRAE